MAELIPQVMFLKGNTPLDYSDLEIAELNLELQDTLGDLVPGSWAYMDRAKAFRLAVAERSKDGRISTL
jgi:hypothetical protein